MNKISKPRWDQLVLFVSAFELEKEDMNIRLYLCLLAHFVMCGWRYECSTLAGIWQVCKLLLS